MKTVEENIDTLSRAILSEVHSEADEILTEAKAKAEEIRQKARQQADTERARILERAKMEAERIRSQAIANAQLKARTLLLEHREKLLENVFTTAREQLPTVEQWSDYDEIAMQLLREAIEQLKASKALVRADAPTQSLLTDETLQALSMELKVPITVGKPLENGTGVVVEADNGHVNYDNTLESRLGRLQNIIRSPVYHLLMGESL